MSKFKYSEDRILKELYEYISATYGEHYSMNNIQSTEFIMDAGHGIGFTVGNMIKYSQRYGKKGTPEDHRKDIVKAIHYGIMALHVHDTQFNNDKEIDNANK